MKTGDTNTSNPMVGVGTNNAPVFHGGTGPVYMPNSTSSPLLGHSDRTGSGYDGSAAFRDNANTSLLPAVGAAQPTYAALVVHNATSFTKGDTAIKAVMDVVFGSPFYTIQSATWNGTVQDNGVIVIAGSTSSSNVTSHFLKSTSGSHRPESERSQRDGHDIFEQQSGDTLCYDPESPILGLEWLHRFDDRVYRGDWEHGPDLSVERARSHDERAELRLGHGHHGGGALGYGHTRAVGRVWLHRVRLQPTDVQQLHLAGPTGGACSPTTRPPPR
jgi:hypothetical protein